ncbi:MAG: hypothetical protein AAF547_04115 [Actinomycetota bacterium]
MATDFPRTYDQWRHCITVDCGIELTADFVDTRLRALRDPADPQTAQFIEIYGEPYLGQVIDWFEQAQSETGVGRP